MSEIGWIVGFGYDDSQLAEQRHPTRDDLDKVSGDIPVIIIHQSGHLGVGQQQGAATGRCQCCHAGSRGRDISPQGGSWSPTGAGGVRFFHVLSKLMANFDASDNDALVVEGTRLLALRLYHGPGGRAMGKSAAMQRVADSGRLAVDLVAYPDIRKSTPSSRRAGTATASGSVAPADHR